MTTTQGAKATLGESFTAAAEGHESVEAADRLSGIHEALGEALRGGLGATMMQDKRLDTW